jgi:hypothetical protein
VRKDIETLRKLMDEDLKPKNPADEPSYQVVEVDQRVIKDDLKNFEEEITWGKYCWFFMDSDAIRDYKKKGTELGNTCVATMKTAFDQIHQKYLRHLDEQKRTWAKEYAAEQAAKEKEKLKKEKLEEEARLKKAEEDTKAAAADSEAEDDKDKCREP